MCAHQAGPRQAADHEGDYDELTGLRQCGLTSHIATRAGQRSAAPSGVRWRADSLRAPPSRADHDSPESGSHLSTNRVGQTQYPETVAGPFGQAPRVAAVERGLSVTAGRWPGGHGGGVLAHAEALHRLHWAAGDSGRRRTCALRGHHRRIAMRTWRSAAWRSELRAAGRSRSKRTSNATITSPPVRAKPATADRRRARSPAASATPAPTARRPRPSGSRAASRAARRASSRSA